MVVNKVPPAKLPKARVRRKEAGFVGVNLAKGGDMTLYNRLQAEVDSDPELDQSKVIRLALKEYFEKRDKRKASNADQ